MKKVIYFSSAVWLALFLLLPNIANAQSQRNPCYYTSANPGPGNGCIPVSSANPLPVTASVSVGGFTPSLSYTTLTATASSSASTALPTNTGTVAFQNNTAVGVSCTLASGAATATTNELLVPAGSTIFVGTTGYDHAACINQTGSASNVIVLAGGTGLGTGFGGGSSGGGSSGAVFGPTAGGIAAANPPVQIGGVQTNSNTGLVQPWVINSSGNGLIDAPAGSNLANLVAAPVPYLIATTCTTNTYTNGQTQPGNANLNGNACVFIANTSIAVTGTFFQATQPISAASLPLPTGAATSANQILDACSGLKTNLPISFTATASLQIIALSGSTKIYVCSLALIASVATNFSLTGGTGTNCGTPAALIGTTSASNGVPLAANGGLTLGNGLGTVAVTGAGSELCIVQSGAGNIVGNLTYVQQ